MIFTYLKLKAYALEIGTGIYDDAPPGRISSDPSEFHKFAPVISLGRAAFGRFQFAHNAQ